MTTRRPKSWPAAALVTLGCPMNQVDSERIMSGLVARGFVIVPEDEADVVVVNTCGFIADAVEESVETILSLAGLRERGRMRALVVAGCLAERYRDDLAAELTEADAVVGLDGRDTIPDLCLDLLGAGKPSRETFSRVVTGPPHTAYLRISEGCDNRCTYCTIPAIRGPFRSVPPDEVLRDAADLVSLGARELILIGQDTTRYGDDLDGGGDLAGLLEKLSGIDGLAWLRLMYTHPAHFTGRLVDAMADLPRVLPYVDMPLQHIATPVLRRMGRGTPPGDIRRLLDRLRSRVEGVALRTALIVGFPGETDGDFGELMAFARDVRFERLGAFIYSPEEGTPAERLPDRVPGEVALERYERLMEQQAGLSATFHESLTGREFDMIVDSRDPDTGGAEGRTYMDAPDVDCAVTVPEGVPEGDAFVRVRITGGGPYDLTGEVAGG